MDPIERFRMLRDEERWRDAEVRYSRARRALAATAGPAPRVRWWAWAVPAVVVAAALAALAAFTLGGVLTLGQGGMPAAPTPTSGPACTTAELSHAISDVGAPQSVADDAPIYLIGVTNSGSTPCTLQGAPSLISSVGPVDAMPVRPIGPDGAAVVLPLGGSAYAPFASPTDVDPSIESGTCFVEAGSPMRLTLPGAGGDFDVTFPTVQWCKPQQGKRVSPPAGIGAFTQAPEVQKLLVGLGVYRSDWAAPTGPGRTWPPATTPPSPDPNAAILAAKKLDAERTAKAEKARLTGLPVCNWNDLSTAGVLLGSVMGTEYADIVVTNTGARECRVDAKPTTQVIAQSGEALGSAAPPLYTPDKPTAEQLDLQPQRTLYLRVAMSGIGGYNPNDPDGTAPDSCEEIPASGIRITFPGVAGSDTALVDWDVCRQHAGASVRGVLPGDRVTPLGARMAIPRCTADQLAMSVGKRYGVTQSWAVVLSFTNQSGSECYLQGYAKLAWVSDGMEIPAPPGKAPGLKPQPLVIIPVGATAYATAVYGIVDDIGGGSASEIAKCAPAPVQAWDVTLPGSTESKRVPLADADEACTSAAYRSILEVGVSARRGGPVAAGGIAGVAPAGQQ